MLVPPLGSALGRELPYQVTNQKWSGERVARRLHPLRGMNNTGNVSACPPNTEKRAHCFPALSSRMVVLFVVAITCRVGEWPSCAGSPLCPGVPTEYCPMARMPSRGQGFINADGSGNASGSGV